ncbi:MAG: hypothetical protein AB7I04_21170 [Pseudomonadales bacterium]
MNTFHKTLLLLITTCTSAIALAATVGQPTTTVKQPPSNLSVLWLDSVAVAPRSITIGSTASVTVRLVRNAIETLTIPIELEGATGGEVMQKAPGVTVPMQVSIPAGSREVVFEVYTQTGSGVTLPKTYKLSAYLGKEVKSTSFTLTSARRSATLPSG